MKGRAEVTRKQVERYVVIDWDVGKDMIVKGVLRVRVEKNNRVNVRTCVVKAKVTREVFSSEEKKEEIKIAISRQLVRHLRTWKPFYQIIRPIRGVGTRTLCYKKAANDC